MWGRDPSTWTCLGLWSSGFVVGGGAREFVGVCDANIEHNAKTRAGGFRLVETGLGLLSVLFLCNGGPGCDWSDGGY